MSKIKYICCFFVVIISLTFPLLILSAEGNVNSSQGAEKGIDIIKTGKYVAVIFVALLIIIKIITKAIHSKKNVGRTTTDNYDNSFFKAPLNNTILEYLRSLDHEKIYLALQQIINCPVISEDVIKELGKMIAMQKPYQNLCWLNITEKCRLTRFLHLALERNRASMNGCNFDSGASFNAIYNASGDCFCSIKGEKETFYKSVINQITELLK